jgi:hypothetical protein
MESKFIEDTNEQYSIREDGVIISNYRVRYSPLHDKYFKSFKEIELKQTKDDKAVRITVNDKKKVVYGRKLIFEYFNISICKKCNLNVNYYLQKNICKKCISKSRSIREKKYRILFPEKISARRKLQRQNNPELYKMLSKKSGEKAKINLTKTYIAGALKIFVKDLPDELYEHHKNLIIFKRKIAKEHNINIEKLV